MSISKFSATIYCNWDGCERSVEEILEWTYYQGVSGALHDFTAIHYVRKQAAQSGWMYITPVESASRLSLIHI